MTRPREIKTLAERGLDFEDAAEVFAGVTLTLLDDRAGLRRAQVPDIRTARPAFGHGGLDPAWRGTPRDLDEEMQCP